MQPAESCATGADVAALPAATRLVHIGPHKTGTTGVQQAFHIGRKDAERYGVHYAGPTRQPMWAATAVVGGKVRVGDRPPAPEDWTQLLDEIRDAGEQRVVLSSEFFCYASDEAARQVVDEVPGGPVHVVITLRSLAKVCPSQWQQYVQNGLQQPFEEWLKGTFADPPDEETTPSFWRRHDHAALVRRWAEAVGADNVTVIVVDESRPTMLLRTFEALTGLPQGLLQRQPGWGNRSLTAPEAELIRQINDTFEDADWDGDWSAQVHAERMREGVLKQMKSARKPASDEARVAMPAWALERSAEFGEKTAQAIRETGVRVIGDVSSLTAIGDTNAAARASLPDSIRADAVALAVAGALSGPKKPGRQARGAASLAVAEALVAENPATDTAQMPLVPVDAAAQAVVGAIEARGALSNLSGLPSIPAATAAAALHVVAKAAPDPDPVAPKADRIAAALDVPAPAAPAKPKPAPAAAATKPKSPAAPTPKAKRTIEGSTVRDLPTSKLVAAVVTRGRRSIRRRLRRLRR